MPSVVDAKHLVERPKSPSAFCTRVTSLPRAALRRWPSRLRFSLAAIDADRARRLAARAPPAAARPAQRPPRPVCCLSRLAVMARCRQASIVRPCAPLWSGPRAYRPEIAHRGACSLRKHPQAIAPLLFSTLADHPHLAALVRKLEVRVYPLSMKVTERLEMAALACRMLRHCINCQELVWTRKGALVDMCVSPLLNVFPAD